MKLVALLRGVNVNGITIKMADLAALFRDDLGFTGVRTVLASGNVVFETSERNGPALKRRIEQALSDRFGYEAWVILVDTPTVQRVIEAFPFDEDDATRQPHVMFLADPAVADELLAVSGDLDPAIERVQPGEGVLYWSPLKGMSTETVFSKHSAKTRFKALTTTRNTRTLRKLLD